MLNLARLLATFLRWRCHVWLPGYFRQSAQRRRGGVPTSGPIDIIFLVVDHFEPSRREGEEGVRKVRDWCEAYRQVASRHRDSDGVPPQHTWFYRYDYPNFECIRILSEYVFQRLGEIEFHLHHGHDTSESFAHKIREGVAWFNQAGAMLSAEPEPVRRFGYIAGNWALDNGRGDPAMSGCNTELEILGRAGCYADFTFPAFDQVSQPSLVNTIYYATDTPRPKSYDTGMPVCAGVPGQGDLMIIPGPLYIDWRGGRVEYAAFEDFAPFRPERLDYWRRAAVHVMGQPQWLFVKLHTHGMQSRKTVLGEQLEQLHSELERRFMSEPYRLHYVTAREAYNIVRAAEAGMTGNPNDYRDFEVRPPANRQIRCNVPYRLEEYSASNVRLQIDDTKQDTVIAFANLPLSELEGGRISHLDLKFSVGRVKALRIVGDGSCRLRFRQDGVGGVRGQKEAEITVSLPYVFVNEDDCDVVESPAGR